MTIYLIAQMEGSIVDLTFKTGVIQRELMNRGHDVMNPLNLYLDTDIPLHKLTEGLEEFAMSKCDAVYCIDERAELIDYARQYGLQIFYDIKEVEAGK